MLDLLVYSSLSASISNLRKHHTWYVTRIAMYRRFDGKDGRRDWRKDIVQCLTEWIRRFPGCMKRLAGSDSYMAGPTVAEDEVQQMALALPVDML